MNKAIDKLEIAKRDILNEIDTYSSNPYPGENLKEPNDNNFKETRLIIKKLASDRAIKLPEFIKECRTIYEAVECLMQEAEYNNYVSDTPVKNYVSRSFNEYIDYLEEEQIDVRILHVKAHVPEELTYTTILELIEKCENRINIGDYSGAVTSAKTLVEGVCKEILKNFPDVEVKKNATLLTLFSQVREKLSLNPGDPKMDNSLKQVITGLNSIVNGISEIRNSYGDSHIYTSIIKEHHALVVVNSAKTVVNFLFGTYSYQLERGTLVLSNGRKENND